MKRTGIEPTERELCSFLCRYSAALLGCGATCIRLDMNVARIARRFNRKVEITIMPRHVHLSVLCDHGQEAVTMIASVPNAAISFNINTRLSSLSWEVADQHLDFDELQQRFDRIIRSDSQNKLLVLLLASVANASFCRLFGGDFIAMAIVFIATAAGYYLKQLLIERKTDTRLVFLLCSFVSSVLGATGILFNLGSTPAIALGTSVLYLVPGIPFLNSFSDMLYRHYICAFSRFTDALILTCCLSIGLCVGMLLMQVPMFH